jgi:hypothetical protein
MDGILDSNRQEDFAHFTDEDFAIIDAPPEAPEELWAYWNDPDEGYCSGPVKVLGSEGDHVIVERDGSTFEVFDDELTYSPGDGIFYG